MTTTHLAVAVVTALTTTHLAVAVLVAHDDHRHAVREQQRCRQVAHLALAQVLRGTAEHIRSDQIRPDHGTAERVSSD